jgi:peptidoglycan/xylan/chitin deacetylase (PgdA/CDA1 family)
MRILKQLIAAALYLVIVGCSSDNHQSSELNVFEGNLRGGLNLDEFTLTFDDGPTVHTSRILDSLKQHNIKATFFVTGVQAQKYPEIMERITAEGHLVANHTYSHPNLPNATDETILDELFTTHDIIKPYVDGESYFFRAPYGAWRTWIADLLNRSGLDFYVGNIFWDIGGVLTETYAADWNCWSKGLSPYDCGNRYINEFKDRRSGIVLMHDVTSNTARMVEYILPKLKKLNYRFVRIDEVQKYRNKISKRRNNIDLVNR